MQTRSRQSGALLFAAIVLVVLIAAMVSVLAYLNAGSLGSSAGHGQSDAAYFAARSGADYARQLYLTGTSCGAALNTTQPVGNGSFTTSGATPYNVFSSTLSGAVTASAATIPVGTMGTYAPFGRILIDSEEMYYGAIQGTNFIRVQRGTSSTVAAAHAAGAVVVQGVCNITSTGTVGTASRSLQINMPGQNYVQGVFTKRTAGTGTQSITGVGFRPNAVILFWTRQTATGATGNGVGVSSGVGFATNLSQYAAETDMLDNNGRSRDGRRSSASNVIIFQDATSPTPLLLAQAGLQSMDTDGFTLNWTTNDNQAYRIYYVALGGDTDASAGNFNMNNATGNQSVTGTGFQPDFVMFIHAGDGSIDTNAADSEFGIGFAQSSSARGALVYAGRTNVNAGITPGWQQLTNEAILFLNHAATPPTAAGQADFVSMDADGFTINVTTASGGANWNVGYLAVRGARVGTGAFNQPTSVGAQSPVTTLAFQPQGVMLVSRSLATGATITCGRTSIGMARGGTIVDANVWYREQCGVATSNANAYNDAINVISMGANNATTNPAQASLQSTNLGGFTLNWTAADATAREILYWAIGPRDYADIQENY